MSALLGSNGSGKWDLSQPRTPRRCDEVVMSCLIRLVVCFFYPDIFADSLEDVHDSGYSKFTRMQGKNDVMLFATKVPSVDNFVTNNYNSIGEVHIAPTNQQVASLRAG